MKLKFMCLCALMVSLFGANAQNTLPWHLGSLDKFTPSAPAAINSVHLTAGPNQIVVALIDSGVMPDHPSLYGQVLPSYDRLKELGSLSSDRSENFSWFSNSTQCEEEKLLSSFNPHGTEVASLIAGNGYDGVLGVNPNAKILPIRLFGKCLFSRSDLLNSIAWAAGMPVANTPPNVSSVRVINLSFSGGRAVCGPDLQSLFDRILQKNIFVVAAAGNTYGRSLLEPANCHGVISVGAVNSENKVADYSALDPRITIYAPGGGVLTSDSNLWGFNKLRVATFSLDKNGKKLPSATYKGVGTSYATPLVAGYISLLLSKTPELTPVEFIEHLKKFSRPVEIPRSCLDCRPRSLDASTR
jgi:serine protease